VDGVRHWFWRAVDEHGFVLDWSEPPGTGFIPVTDRTLQIVRERLARGELTREQFEAIKHDLGH
jgi:Short C-terminal domain